MLGAKKKPEIDLAVVLGGGGKKGDGAEPPPMSAEPDGDEEAEGEDELPPGFAQAGEEFLDTERPLEERLMALHRAIKACGSY